jgi:hypothetical protein
VYPEIQSALTSLNILNNWRVAHKDLTDSVKLDGAFVEIQENLTTIQEKLVTSQQDRLALQNKVTELEDEIRKFKNEKAEIGKYKRHRFPNGTLARVSDEAMDERQDPTYICETCANKSVISTLQPDGYHNGVNFFLHCHVCSLLIPIRGMSNALERSIRTRMKT